MKSKSERFIELIGDYDVEISIDTFPHFMIFNGGWTICHLNNKSYTFISYYRIISFFEKEYNMADNEIKTFLEEMLIKYFKIDKTTISFSIPASVI